MSWKTFHRRGEILRTVIETANRRRDGRLPLDVPGVSETFTDDVELLGALQLRWHTRLSGRIERELSGQPMDLEGAVVTAWCATADELPGVRAVLDHYRAEPTGRAMAEAVRAATAKEHVLLAAMAGRANAHRQDGATQAVGERLERAARAAWTARADGAGKAPAPDERPSLLDRLRSALVA